MQVLFLQGHSTCFGRKRPSSGVFKTSTAATGTCVIVVGQPSHLLIRAGTEFGFGSLLPRPFPHGYTISSTAVTGFVLHRCSDADSGGCALYGEGLRPLARL